MFLVLLYKKLLFLTYHFAFYGKEGIMQ